jgi:hypothetical protein
VLPIAAVMLLASCGVSTTGVIDAGAPATLPATSLTVYLLQRGRPVPVQRLVQSVPSPSTALELLFEGPTAAERAHGYETDLPPLSGPPQVVDKSGTMVDVVLPDDTDNVRPLGLYQIACTTAEALRRTRPLQPPTAPAATGAATSVPSPSGRPDPLVLVTVRSGKESFGGRPAVCR